MKRNMPSAGDANPHAAPQPGHVTPLDRSHRRRLLQAITAAGATSAALPDRWSRPVVDAVLLPAHAQATPVSSCALTCTNAIQETWLLGRPTDFPGFVGIVAFSRGTFVQCISANGQISQSSTVTSETNGIQFSNLPGFPGTISTAFTLSSFTGTDFGTTNVTLESTTGFLSAC